VTIFSDTVYIEIVQFVILEKFIFKSANQHNIELVVLVFTLKILT